MRQLKKPHCHTGGCVGYPVPGEGELSSWPEGRPGTRKLST